MEYVNCNLCQSNNAKQVFYIQDWLSEGSLETSRLVRCQNCGLIYQNPRPSVKEVGNLYPPDYELYEVEKEIKSSSWIKKRIMEYGIYKRCRIVNREKTGGELLDIGCATGIFLESMQQRGQWQLKGVEISEHAASIARTKKKLDVFTGTLEQTRFSDNQFDVITLWDVMEHLHDPSESLREIHRILKPDGIMILRVPNGGSLDAKLFGRFWAGLEPPRHLYVFDSITLEKLLHINGFKIKRMSCEIGSYPTFVLSLRFWMAGRGFDVNTRKRISNFLYSPFARIISAPLFFIVGVFNKGPLLIVTSTPE